MPLIEQSSDSSCGSDLEIPYLLLVRPVAQARAKCELEGSVSAETKQNVRDGQRTATEVFAKSGSAHGEFFPHHVSRRLRAVLIALQDHGRRTLREERAIAIRSRRPGGCKAQKTVLTPPGQLHSWCVRRQILPLRLLREEV